MTTAQRSYVLEGSGHSRNGMTRAAALLARRVTGMTGDDDDDRPTEAMFTKGRATAGSGVSGTTRKLARPSGLDSRVRRARGCGSHSQHSRYVRMHARSVGDDVLVSAERQDDSR